MPARRRNFRRPARRGDAIGQQRREPHEIGRSDQTLGAEVSDLGILRDDAEKLAARLAEAASGHDLVLTSGGVSTGEADYVKDAIGAAGSLVCWRVAYAGVFSGSIVLMDAGVLDPLWRAFDADPDGYARRAAPRGVGSDQAMLNFYLSRTPAIRPAVWTEADGLVTFFGKGYERLERRGVGPGHPHLPRGARIVVLGSDDLEVLEQSAHYPWVSEWR